MGLFYIPQSAKFTAIEKCGFHVCNTRISWKWFLKAERYVTDQSHTFGNVIEHSTLMGILLVLLQLVKPPASRNHREDCSA